MRLLPPLSPARSAVPIMTTPAPVNPKIATDKDSTNTPKPALQS